MMIIKNNQVIDEEKMDGATSSSSSNSAISFDKSGGNTESNESSNYTSGGSGEYQDIPKRPSVNRQRSSSLNKLDPLKFGLNHVNFIQNNDSEVKSPGSVASSSSASTESAKSRRHTFSGPLVIELNHPIVQPSISNLINQDNHQHTPPSQYQFNKALPAEPLPQMPAPLPTPTYRKYHKPHGQSSEHPPELIPFSSSLQLPSLHNWSLDSSALPRKMTTNKRKLGNDVDNHHSSTTSQAIAASQQDDEYANSQVRKLDNEPDLNQASGSANASANPNVNATASTSNTTHQLTPTHSTTSTASTSKGKIYTCEYCYKTFNRPSSLKIHTYSHTGERPFVCQVTGCNRSFSVASNLKRHAKVHNNSSHGSEQQEQHERPEQQELPQQYTQNNVSQQHTNKITNKITDVDSPTLTKEPSPVDLTLSQVDKQASGLHSGSSGESSGDSKHNSGGAGEYADMEDDSSSGNEKKRENEDDSVTLAQDVNSRKSSRHNAQVVNGTSDWQGSHGAHGAHQSYDAPPSLERTSQVIDGKLKSTMRVPQTQAANDKRMINALNNGRSISIDGKSLTLQSANRSIDENGTIVSSKYHNEDRQAPLKEEEKLKQEQKQRQVVDDDEYDSSNEIYSSPNEDEDEDMRKLPIKQKILN
ncbi:hypothetical protein E3P92_00856 [Wallemia ichthyophaga]|nr:hypothetical protein E3P92_00856 [Wallemia ichthyophaga]